MKSIWINIQYTYKVCSEGSYQNLLLKIKQTKKSKFRSFWRKIIKLIIICMKVSIFHSTFFSTKLLMRILRDLYYRLFPILYFNHLLSFFLALVYINFFLLYFYLWVVSFLLNLSFVYLLYSKDDKTYVWLIIRVKVNRKTYQGSN